MKIPSLWRFGATLLLSAPLISTFRTSPAHAAPPAYHLAAVFMLGGTGGWDYITNDSAEHRLYISRGNRIQIVDTQTGVSLGEITGLNGAHGVALDPKLNRAFATSGNDGTVVPFDIATLKPVGAPIKVGDRPDAITYEPVTGEIFAMNAGSNNVSIIDARGEKVIGTVALEGNPEFAAADGLGNVFVNSESSSQIVKIDAKTMKIVNTWSLAPGEEPTGLVYDAKDGLLFAGCGGNNMMIALDVKTGKVVASLPIGAGVDATSYDPDLGLAFSSNGRDGNVTVVGKDDTGKLAVLNTLITHNGSRTMTLDPKTHSLFMLAPDTYTPTPAPAPAAAPQSAPAPATPPQRGRGGPAVLLRFDRAAA